MFAAVSDYQTGNFALLELGPHDCRAVDRAFVFTEHVSLAVLCPSVTRPEREFENCARCHLATTANTASFLLDCSAV